MDKKQSKVKVVVRVRPPLAEAEKTCVSATGQTVEIFNHRNVRENILYHFTSVFGMDASQQQLYTDSVLPLLHKPLNGQNVSIFAYGPTGAGKTHTMLGTSSSPGVIPRVINSLFEKISECKQSEPEWKYKVSFSYLEIYNEKVQDLLEPTNADLPIREDADKNILIPGLAKIDIQNFNDFKQAFGPASTHRTTAATKLNTHSSRSHSIVQLTVTKSKPCKELLGKIYLIDLAGSEDNRRTGNKGIRLKESGAINKSLFALGEVVDAINTGLPRIPYRNSKLTRLLQDSIGGSCHSVMITNVAPEERYYYDTYCTLNMATKSKKIVNNTVVREMVIVKPQPRIKRSPRPVVEVCPVKRQKLSESVPESVSKPVPAVPESAPSLSPLMHRQSQLEETVNRRLQDLEDNIITQMKSFTSQSKGCETPKTKALHDLQKQLQETQTQLKELTRQHFVAPPAAPPAVTAPPTVPVTAPPTVPVIAPPTIPVTAPSTATVCAQQKTQTTVQGTNKSSTTLSDATNHPKEEKSVAGRKGRPLCGMKRKKEEEFTCSPLFATHSRVFKRGFTSSASAGSLKDVGKENTSTDSLETADGPFNSTSQQKRNEEFLHMLNSSDVKDLQSLHAVGTKRAKLIYEWRQSYGLFKKVEDLTNIPSFTEKFVQKLLQNNLVTVT